MNEDDLTKQLEFINPNELMVVSWFNELIVLKCPFRVKVIDDIGHLNKGDKVFVTKVKVTPDLIAVFLIDDKAFYYYHFDILIDN